MLIKQRSTPCLAHCKFSYVMTALLGTYKKTSYLYMYVYIYIYVCPEALLSWKGRVGKVNEEIKLSTELNQRNNRSLYQQIYQYGCAKDLLQTVY